jgi:hypothetical protein
MILTSKQRFGTWGKGLREPNHCRRDPGPDQSSTRPITVDIRGNSDDLLKAWVTSVKLHDQGVTDASTDTEGSLTDHRDRSKS